MLTLKALCFILQVQYWGGMFSTPSPLCKIRPRHPRESKLTWLIAYIMFYKICKFEGSTITNDVISKNSAKFGPPPNQTSYIYHSKGIDKNYSKMYCLLNLSLCVKSYGHFCQILAFLQCPRTKYGHVRSKFRIFLFCPNTTLNITDRPLFFPRGGIVIGKKLSA